MNTTIQIEAKTRNLLKNYGFKDETYNVIIKRLIDIAEKTEFFEEQKKILRKEKFTRVENL